MSSNRLAGGQTCLAADIRWSSSTPRCVSLAAAAVPVQSSSWPGRSRTNGKRGDSSSTWLWTPSRCRSFTCPPSGASAGTLCAELDAIQRWDRNQPTPPLHQVGVDEKWLGRRHKRKEKFVTIVSNLETGVPLWIGYGRGSETLKSWLDTLGPEQKAAIRLFACDMHEPFKKAIRDDPGLHHAAIVHDPFHVIKRAGEAVTELRRSIFFRASPELREVGRGTRWLVLRSWDHTAATSSVAGCVCSSVQR